MLSRFLRYFPSLLNIMSRTLTLTHPCRPRSPCCPCRVSRWAPPSCSSGPSPPPPRARPGPGTAARKRGPSSAARNTDDPRCPLTWWQSLGQNIWNIVKFILKLIIQVTSAVSILWIGRKLSLFKFVFCHFALSLLAELNVSEFLHRLQHYPHLYFIPVGMTTSILVHFVIISLCLPFSSMLSLRNSFILIIFFFFTRFPLDTYIQIFLLN